MAILRMTDARKMSAKDRETRLSELRMELTRAMNKGSQQKGKRKELKRAISRILTLNNSAKEELKKQ